MLVNRSEETHRKSKVEKNTTLALGGMSHKKRIFEPVILFCLIITMKQLMRKRVFALCALGKHTRSSPVAPFRSHLLHSFWLKPDDWHVYG